MGGDVEIVPPSTSHSSWAYLYASVRWVQWYQGTVELSQHLDMYLSTLLNNLIRNSQPRACSLLSHSSQLPLPQKKSLVCGVVDAVISP